MLRVEEELRAAAVGAPVLAIEIVPTCSNLPILSGMLPSPSR